MTSSATAPGGQPVSRQPRAARVALSLLERLSVGSLRLTLPDGTSLAFGEGEPSAAIVLENWRMFDEVMRRGDIGFAQTWIDGDWTTESLADLLGLMVLNRQALESAVYGTWWGQLLDRIRHLLRANTRSGARRNIHAHYDLGNPFYELWLDPGMTYSSALFAGDPHRSLEQAQDAKNARLLDELALPAGARVLEIGCGWGGFALAASRRGLEATGLTLSTEQLAYAQARLAAAGYPGARFVLQDYRDERGVYDGIASVEMFEAVGERYWPDYFATIARCLRPGGRAVIQTITIAPELFERYRRGTDFIQQYVFPGGMLPSAPRFEMLARQAGLRVREQFAFGLDYANTLRLWRERFMAVLPQVKALGFDLHFIRIWEFYLAYCEAAFRYGNTDVIQYTLERP